MQYASVTTIKDRQNSSTFVVFKIYQFDVSQWLNLTPQFRIVIKFTIYMND